MPASKGHNPFRIAASASARRFRTSAAKFTRDRKASTIVEFALVAAPFFALLFAVLQTALIFFAGQVFETGVAEAARLIRTGQAQSQGFDQSAFKQAVCDRIFGLISCTGALNVDVRTYPAFDQVDVSKPLDSQGNLINNFQYNPGAGGDIVVVRAFFEWPIFVPLLGVQSGDMANGNRLLAAAFAFRNEPF